MHSSLNFLYLLDFLYQLDVLGLLKVLGSNMQFGTIYVPIHNVSTGEGREKEAAPLL